MNPGNFYIPNMAMPAFRNVPVTGMRNIPILRANSIMPQNIGILGRIGNGIKSFNWSGLLNGANKTLNVMNQTIPLIRQAKPMFNNMKSMVRLARAFGSETISNNSRIKKSHIDRKLNNSSNNITNKDDAINNKDLKHDSYPNFFI